MSEATENTDRDDKENFDIDALRPGHSDQVADNNLPAVDEKGKSRVDGTAEGDKQDDITTFDVEGGDLQLAWENLETARAIWSKDENTYSSELADVHLLLGDVAMENEAFEDALSDFDSALKAGIAAGYNESDRRVAELHFKKSAALHYLGRVKEALEAVHNAISSLEKYKASQDDASSSASVAEVDAILEELRSKVEELEGSMRDITATKAAVVGAMEELVKSSGTSGHDTSPIKDLGTVGRGKKRIRVASEQQEDSVKNVDTNEKGQSTSADDSNKRKRSLEMLMQPSTEQALGAETVIGFGKSNANT